MIRFDQLKQTVFWFLDSFCHFLKEPCSVDVCDNGNTSYNFILWLQTSSRCFTKMNKRNMQTSYERKPQTTNGWHNDFSYFCITPSRAPRFTVTAEAAGKTMTCSADTQGSRPVRSGSGFSRKVPKTGCEVFFVKLCWKRVNLLSMQSLIQAMNHGSLVLIRDERPLKPGCLSNSVAHKMNQLIDSKC